MNPDLFWVPGPWHGRLAVIGRPRGGDWLEDEVSAWRRAGLDVIVSLLEAEEAAQLELLEEEALSLFAKIGRKLDGGENVAIHCRQSVGRSGMVAAGLLITAGMGVDKAI